MVNLLNPSNITEHILQMEVLGKQLQSSNRIVMDRESAVKVLLEVTFKLIIQCQEYKLEKLLCRKVNIYSTMISSKECVKWSESRSQYCMYYLMRYKNSVDTFATSYISRWKVLAVL